MTLKLVSMTLEWCDSEVGQCDTGVGCDCEDG